MYKNIVVVGSSGAIGGALCKQLKIMYPDANIIKDVNISCEESIASTAKCCAEESIDLVIVATGLLHSDKLGIMPEKSLKDLSKEKFMQLFLANSITPALVMKHFLPKMNMHSRSVFAVLSAKVGSISDNRLGGWYSYRASKAALNMIIKNAAIEMHRVNKSALVIGLHPGTVDSRLSKPFQANVPNLFTPEQSAKYLIDVLNSKTSKDSGKLFSYTGDEILP